MLLSISFPLLRSFEHRLRFYNNWFALALSILIMMTVFIPWDVIFTSLEIWYFNDRYILGYKFLKLPLEEWMFFICIPYSCIFIHEVLNYFFPLKKIRFKIHRWTSWVTILILLIGVVFWNKMYTCVCFILCGGFLILFQRNSDLFLTSLYRTYLVCLIPFFIVNGILTGSITNEPIVIYEDFHNTTLRILTIPIEDFIYCFLMLGLTIWTYESLKQKNLGFFQGFLRSGRDSNSRPHA